MPRGPSARKAALAANKGKPVKKVPKVGPLSSRSLEEQAEQAELRARLGNPAAAAATPEPAERAPGARRETPCMGCLRSALSGRSEGTCYDLAGAGRAKRCFKCSSGHTCSPVPAPAQRAARELVAALEAQADKKIVSAARRRVRELLGELEEVEEEQQQQSSPARARSEELGEDEEEIEDEDEDEEELGGSAALREQRKRELKTGLCALVDLLFE